MTSQIYVTINGQQLDSLSNDFEFRLNRFIQDIQNFQSKGGDFSYAFEIPLTKNNQRIFNVSYALQAINKFNRTVDYTFTFGINGLELMRGTAILNEITNTSISVEFRGENIDWIQLLEEKTLNRLGYVNNIPTWFGGNRLGSIFEGGDTINQVNELGNRETDYICPTILRYNTPVTDYYDEAIGDIFGITDSGGDEILAPKEYPDNFSARRAFYSQRQGLTFEDFPPALYYRNLIEKCFSDIGYNVGCNLFNEDWFNRLYIPYIGEDFYQYNWKTLAELKVRFDNFRLISDSAANIETDPEVASIILPTAKEAFFYRHRIGNSDDVPQRVDRVANFNKFLVSDQTNGYVVPTKGKYRIRVKTELWKQHTGFAGTLSPALIAYDALIAGSSNQWSNTVFVILRKSPEGTTLLREDPLRDIAQWMSGQYAYFTNTPSDVIAFYSPYQATVYGSSQDPNASGSPLTNFQTPVTVNSGTYSFTNTAVTSDSLSTGDFEIEVDLLQNERVEFYAITLGLLKFSGSPQMTWYDANINQPTSLIDIDYICAYDDISLADNLPETSCKEFIKDFVNTFNLRWIVDDKNKTVRFVTEREFFNKDLPYDITQRVDVDTVKYLPTGVPKNVRIGYENDLEDNELNIIVSGCIEDVRTPTNYANKTFFDNPNIYAKDIQDFNNGFSATRFVEGDFSDLADFNNLVLSVDTFTIPFPIPFYSSFVIGRTFGDRQSNNLFRLSVPSVQSITSVEERLVGDLNYDFNQGRRLLQHYGTVGLVDDTITVTTKDYRMIIGAPDNSVCLDSKYWIRPTYSSFSLEQPTYSSFANPANISVPTQSMRYDITGGLYDKYFSDIIELQNKSYVMTCQAYLRGNDWNALQGNRIVKYLDATYRLLEISDYDVTGLEPCTLKLLKLV